MEPEGPVVLLVDDEIDVRRLVSRTLTNAGYRVCEAANGPEAIALFDRVAGVALVLTGLLMPGMTGNQLARRLRRQRPEVAVVVMSGGMGLFPELLEVDSDYRVIAKPFLPEKLLEVVGEVLARPRRILLVDDEEDMVDCLRLMLGTKAHWVIEAASDPVEALRMLRAARFDLLVTDIVMAQMSGIELAREARTTQPHLQVILISGKVPEDDPGAQDSFAFLAKPFRAGPLVNVVEQALAAS